MVLSNSFAIDMFEHFAKNKFEMPPAQPTSGQNVSGRKKLTPEYAFETSSH
jgi:hypothetical protein